MASHPRVHARFQVGLSFMCLKIAAFLDGAKLALLVALLVTPMTSSRVPTRLRYERSRRGLLSFMRFL